MELYDFNIGSGIFIQIGAGAGDLDKELIVEMDLQSL